MKKIKNRGRHGISRAGYSTCRRYLYKNHRRLQEEDRALCYSTNGLLVDVLEHNGFAVYSIEHPDQHPDVYRVTVRITPETKELVVERLRERIGTSYQ
jgi:DNA-directed RNA polymerase subunit L